MKTFIIDPTDRVKMYLSSHTGRLREGVGFTTEQGLLRAAEDWPIGRLVAIWNQLPGVTPVRKFTSRAIALRRIWAALKNLPPESRTKSGLVIGMLSRPGGATLKEIMAATGWQPHTVRGFICTQPKKLEVQIESFKREGERVYRIR